MAVNALVMEHVFTLQYHYCSLPTKLKVKLGLGIRKKNARNQTNDNRNWYSARNYFSVYFTV